MGLKLVFFRVHLVYQAGNRLIVVHMEKGKHPTSSLFLRHALQSAQSVKRKFKIFHND